MCTLPHQEPGVSLLERQLGVQCQCWQGARCTIHDPELLLAAIQKFEADQKQLLLPLSNCPDCGNKLDSGDAQQDLLSPR